MTFLGVQSAAEMSQFLAVSGQNAGSVQTRFDAATASFRIVCGLQPLCYFRGGTTSIAVFPRRKCNATAGIVSIENQGRQGWMCGGGTWFWNGLTGETALRSLGLALLGSNITIKSGLSQIDGHFSLVMAMTNPNELVIITDRLGTFHVYECRLGAESVITTSALTLAHLSQSGWDLEGCRQFLATGTVFEPTRSLFLGVTKLEPHRILRYRDGRRETTTSYWQPADVMLKPRTLANPIPALADAIGDTLSIVKRNFPRALMDLTGGFDTRTLLGALLRRNLEFDVVVNGHDKHPDVLASSRIASEFDLRHHHLSKAFSSANEWFDCANMSVSLTDGECDVFQYASVFHSHNLYCTEFDATINGAIGELCQGHWWELLSPFVGSRHHFDPKLLARRRFVAQDDYPGLLAQQLAGPLEQLFADLIVRTNADLIDVPNTVKVDHVYLMIRQQKWLGRYVSSTDRLWPCISPYGFRLPLETVLSVPARLRNHHRLSRRLIEYECPRLAALPLADGSPATPIRLRNINSFRPLLARYSRLGVRRLARSLGSVSAPHTNPYQHSSVGTKEFLREVNDRGLLSHSSMNTAQLYNRSALDQLVESAASRPSPQSDRRLGRILTLELVGRTIRRSVGA